MGETSRRDFLKIFAASLAAAAAGLFPSFANESESAENKEYPDPSRHVFVIGDLHLTRKDPYAEIPILLDALESLSRGKKGFHIIFNGDLLEFPDREEYCENGEWQWQQFLVLDSILSSAGFTTHALLGNHDGSEEFARQITRGRIPGENLGTSAFSLENGARLILLSGTVPDRYDSGFLRSELMAGPAGNTFVFSHFHPDSMDCPIESMNAPPGYGIIARNPKIMRLISSSGATLISSHLHSPYIGTYHSRLLPKPVNLVSTPSFSYKLPFFNSAETGKREFGITIIDTSIKGGRASFFDKGKRFHIPGREAESYHGKYVPGDFSRKIIPGFPPKQFLFLQKRSF